MVWDRGELVEVATEATGIKSVVDMLGEKTGKDCGCSKRREKLDEWVPFGSKEEGEDESQE